MWEVPKYIRGRISFTMEEIELLIESIALDCLSIKQVDRFIQSRLTYYEIGFRDNSITDFEVQDYKDWKDVETYFELHKLSFERQYFRKKV